MTLDGWLAVGAVVVAITVLTRTRIAPDLVLVGAVTLLLVLGVVSPEGALIGFSNSVQ